MGVAEWRSPCPSRVSLSNRDSTPTDPRSGGLVRRQCPRSPPAHSSCPRESPRPASGSEGGRGPASGLVAPRRALPRRRGVSLKTLDGVHPPAGGPKRFCPTPRRRPSADSVDRSVLRAGVLLRLSYRRPPPPGPLVVPVAVVAVTPEDRRRRVRGWSRVGGRAGGRWAPTAAGPRV